MRKIPTVFIRDEATGLRYVRNEVHPACQWVLDGEGVATRKFDGTCVMLDDDGEWWARREVKAGRQSPPGFVEVERDPVTMKAVGWEPIEQSAFARWHAVALQPAPLDGWQPGTYELVGPKVNGNPEGFRDHTLVQHAAATPLADTPRDFDGLAVWLHAHTHEGIVWHHPDGRMAKLKAKDFPKGDR